MYTCPHCHDLSVSALSQFSAPFDGRAKCPTCGAILKVARSPLNFLFPAYILLSISAERLAGIDLETTSVTGLVAACIVGLLQCRAVRYEVAEVAVPPRSP